MSVLIVIPVRSGNVGVPNKAFRALAEGPSCLERVLTTARETVGQRHVVVVSDTIEDLPVGLIVRDPPGVVGQRPLDVVVHHGVQAWERMTGELGAIVVTMQATSPFTSGDLVRRAVAVAEAGKTALTVRDDRALRWTGGLTNRHPDKAPPRLIRQQMAPVWRETGAVWATPRCWVTPTSRLAPVVDLIEVTGAEAVDIDTWEDWAVAEWYATREVPA